MWKLLFVARRGWKMIPREQRRALRRNAIRNARKHGPVVAKVMRGAAKSARSVKKAR
jgi:hypothetical protein